jgi:hypothetical protein
VTTSETEPVGACDGDFWADESEAGAGSPSVDERQLARAFVRFIPTNPPTKNSSFNVSTVAYKQAGLYDVNFERPMADDNYCALATADVFTTATNAVTAITRRQSSDRDSVEVVTCNADAGGSGNQLVNPASVKVVVFSED